MANKNDAFYFNHLAEAADCACRAARILQSSLSHFDREMLDEELGEVHKAEHEGDIKKHEMLEALAKAFITPLEREDIMALSQTIDDVTDNIDDVLLRFYMTGVAVPRPGALAFSDLILRSCETMKKLMEELPEYKKSKELHTIIVEINRLEGEGDQLFIDSMKELYQSEKDPVAIMIWRDIFNYMERCLDACEHVADAVEMVIMKNS